MDDEQRNDRRARDEANPVARASTAEPRWQALVDCSRDLVYRYRLLEPRGFEYVSPSATEITGYTPAEHYADPDLHLRIVHPDDRSKLPEEGALSEPLLLRWIRRDGGLVWVEHQNVAVRDETADVIAIEGIVRDVTHRVRAEEQVRRLENELRLCQMSRQFSMLGGVAIVAIDANQRVSFVNSKTSELLGRAEEDIIGQNWFDHFIPELERARTREGFKQLMAGEIGAVEYFENFVVTESGELRLIAWHNTVLRDEDDRIVGSLSLGQDVTARRLAEKEGAESASLGLWEWELDSNLLFGNDKLFEICGLPRQVPMPRATWTNAIHPDDRALAEAWLREAVETKCKGATQFRVVRPDGETRWIEAYARPVSDEAGRVSRVFCTSLDITEQKLAEAQLQASEAQLRLITDSIPVMVSRVDRERRFLFANAAYERFFGLTRSELRGKLVRDLIGEDAYGEVEASISEALNGGRSIFEVKLTNKSGQPRDVAGQYVPDRDESGEVVGFYAVLVDVTEERQLEAAVRHSQKMDAVGQLASGVAHDFNNLLMGVKGCSEVALSQLAPDSPVRPLLEEIRTAASNGAGITRQLLDFGRRSDAELIDLSPDAVVQSKEGMLRLLVSANVSLRLDLQAGEAFIRLEKGQLEQILVNLVANARDATLLGGEIEIATRAVEFSAEQSRVLGGMEPGKYVTLSVRDTGTGMDAATADRVFEPFFTTKEVGHGTGLGLASVYAIVTKRGGRIEVHSIVGEGTIFTLYLPRAEGESSVAERKPQGRVGAETVLVVEDDRLVLMIVSHYLRRWGYQPIEASDGGMAVKKAREHRGPLALLISDMALPGMSGTEVARAVQEIHPETKVIHISAHSAETLATEGALEPDLEILQKPFGEAELLARIRQALES